MVHLYYYAQSLQQWRKFLGRTHTVVQGQLYSLQITCKLNPKNAVIGVETFRGYSCNHVAAPTRFCPGIVPLAIPWTSVRANTALSTHALWFSVCVTGRSGGCGTWAKSFQTRAWIEWELSRARWESGRSWTSIIRPILIRLRSLGGSNRRTSRSRCGWCFPWASGAILAGTTSTRVPNSIPGRRTSRARWGNSRPLGTRLLIEAHF